MSGIMDATCTRTLLPCASCHREEQIACCYCEMELCVTYAPGHLALCAYAKARRFKTVPTRVRQA
jgi:hypothetical protein